MRDILLILAIAFSVQAAAQPDTLPDYRKRKWLVGGATAGLWAGSTVVLNEVWYKDYPKSSFHSFNDANNWRYMDKLGHVFTTYKLSSLQYAAWRWAGVPRRKAVFFAAGVAWGYQAGVEVLDGFSSEWGFSFADLAANTVGAGTFIVQQLKWDKQYIRLKYSYKPSRYADLRPNVLGANLPERVLKDYNAQSYWLSVSPGPFLPKGYFPRWLQFSFGYSTDQLLKGDSDNYTIDGFTYRARSEYGVSLDIDWSQLPIRRPWLRKGLTVLNSIKVPFPAVYWRGGVCYVGLM